MPCTIKNNSGSDLSQVTGLVNAFYPYAKKSMGFDKDVVIVFESDLKNAQNPLGKTAFYDPGNFTVTVYVDKRHPKDIMRSVSHELVHHHQNCQGKFENIGPTEEGYAQSDPYLREMEEDAYRRGNLCFRDWENRKNQLRENKKMKSSKKSLKELVKGVLKERTRRDSPDRTNKPLPPDRLKPLEEKEEELEEGGAADRPENKDKHVAEPDRGKRVHLEEDDEPVNCEEIKERVAKLYADAEETAREYMSWGQGYAHLAQDAAAPINATAGKLKEENPQCFEKKKSTVGLSGELGGLGEDKEEEKPLKEWYDNSIYNKLIKEYTKR